MSLGCLFLLWSCYLLGWNVPAEKISFWPNHKDIIEANPSNIAPALRWGKGDVELLAWPAPALLPNSNNCEALLGKHVAAGLDMLMARDWCLHKGDALLLLHEYALLRFRGFFRSRKFRKRCFSISRQSDPKYLFVRQRLASDWSLVH